MHLVASKRIVRALPSRSLAVGIRLPYFSDMKKELLGMLTKVIVPAAKKSQGWHGSFDILRRLGEKEESSKNHREDSFIMSDKKKLRVIYRSNAHSPFWVVSHKSALSPHNRLEIHTSPQLVGEKAVESLKEGDVDVISGNHHNLYARNSKGEDFLHLAQAANTWTDNFMVVSDGIKSVKDLRGKKVVVDKVSSHSGLNVWLFLRQEGLDVDRGDVQIDGMDASY